ncbi:MAG: DUF6894 family protein [Allosphingosinicella sp.]
MPRFFFHIRNGNGFTRDEEGCELADVDAARDVAGRGIRSLLAEEVHEGSIDLRGAINVTDEAGEPLFSMRFDEALRIDTGDPPPG